MGKHEYTQGGGRTAFCLGEGKRMALRKGNNNAR